MDNKVDNTAVFFCLCCVLFFLDQAFLCILNKEKTKRQKLVAK